MKTLVCFAAGLLIGNWYGAHRETTLDFATGQLATGSFYNRRLRTRLGTVPKGAAKQTR